MSSFLPLAREFRDRDVRYLLIGVSGANLHAHRAGVVFTTQDRDVFLPRDPSNLLRAWEGCAARGLSLTAGSEPLDEPHDALLAERVVQAAALTSASDGDGLDVDLTFVMAGYEFDDAWRDRVVFELSGVPVPVARLEHIVRSKAAAGREKDRLFLATHFDALRQLLGGDGPADAPSA